MNPSRFSRLIDIAKALYHQNLRCFHVTFILKKGKILSIGTNSSKTHPRNTRLNYRGQDGSDLRYQIGTHAELSAVLRYGAEDCSDCIFVNIRVDKNGQLLYSHPCAGCSSLMRQIGFKKFYYSTVNGFEIL